MNTKCKHTVYILECKDGTFYTGYTNNLSRRIAMHEAGTGAKYTRGRGPFVLKYYAEFETKQKAMQEEYRIKQLNRLEKMERIHVFQERKGQDEYTEKL